MPSTPCLIYGANGYTGALIARMAAERGMRPILAGRNRDAIVAQAGALGLEYRVFALDDAAALDVALDGVTVALHCAGPFAHTARPMVDGCLRKKTHYLDITGEAAVFEALARRDAQAKAAGIMLLPGAGFDVVPSDCLAAHLKRRLPGACRLALAFLTLSRVSWGTATTAVENLHRGGLVRQDGQLVSVPAAHKTRTIDFGDRSAAAVALPWGDVSTAFYSTGIPNIEVYSALPASMRRLMVASRRLGWLLGTAPAQRVLKGMIRRQPPGPSDAERARGLSLLWGEVEDAAGARCVARLRAPEGYTLTAMTTLAIVQRVLAGDAPAGFQTPATAYGADFILEFPGVTREDVG
ncbi:MAG TPA: saccharopine dehydrogenase NADP-binding domain-containing protein [Roseiflexaceae bacterium]